MHTTNLTHAFITVAADTRASAGTPPPPKDPPTLAARCHALIQADPYALTSDDVLFTAWADAQGVPASDRDAARAAFFSKGQPCFRASPLTKTYGWGVHHDARGRVALVPMEDAAYARFATGVGPNGEPLQVFAAMRARRG
jgi:hypothetical protein